ncbi:helix-turn-helix transcriptional regulator [Massilia sp. TWR1-2-2]|uniref:helix-turn-helix transcriptional regulator n=1 Tax=Massilia sp. TWR1-2-2 TaxID=2804584 RepID=UPI003CF720F5
MEQSSQKRNKVLLIGNMRDYVHYAPQVSKSTIKETFAGLPRLAVEPTHGSYPTPSPDSAVQSTGSAGAPAVAAAEAADDGDGDGDGDPDSDRANRAHKTFRNTAKTQTAPVSRLRNAVDRIIRMPELKSRIGLSRSTIYEAIKKKEFPSSVSLGPRAVGWLESDIDSWLDSRISSRNES